MRCCFFILLLLSVLPTTFAFANDGTQQIQIQQQSQPPIVISIGSNSAQPSPVTNTAPKNNTYNQQRANDFKVEQLRKLKTRFERLEKDIENKNLLQKLNKESFDRLVTLVTFVITLFAAGAAFAFYSVFEKSKQEMAKIQSFYETELKATRKILKSESQTAISELKEMTEKELCNQRERLNESEQLQKKKLQESKLLQQKITTVLEQQLHSIQDKDFLNTTADSKNTDNQPEDMVIEENETLSDPTIPISFKLLIQGRKLAREGFYEQGYEVACKAIEKNEDPTKLLYYKTTILNALETIHNTEGLSNERKVEIYAHIVELYTTAQEYGLKMEAFDFKYLGVAYKEIYILTPANKDQKLIELATEAFSQCLSTPVIEEDDRCSIAFSAFDLARHTKDKLFLLTLTAQELEITMASNPDENEKFLLGFTYYNLSFYYEKDEKENFIKNAIPLLKLDLAMNHFTLGCCYAGLNDIANARYHFESISRRKQIPALDSVYNNKYLNKIIHEPWFQSIIEKYAPEDNVENAS